MNECESCPLAEKIEKLQQDMENTKNRVYVLEDFKRWAKPILDKIESMEDNVVKVANSQKWMIIIFTSFVAIVSWVYTVQIIKFMEQQPSDKLEIVAAIHNLESKLNKKIEDTNIQIIKSSKINYNTTVRKMKEISKDTE